MISDEDVKQLFQKKLDTPDILTGLVAHGRANAGFRLANNFMMQVFRGLPSHLWKDTHPAGCLRHKTVVNTFGVIPKYCFDCYKVLISPRTVVELFKLLMIFEKLALPNDNPRKCMAERRDYCTGTYKGFIYCRGMEDAKEVSRIVREVIAEDIAPEIPVTTVRGCSEFAKYQPEYARISPGAVLMQYNKGWQFYEDFVDENFIIDKSAYIPELTASDKAAYPAWEIFAMQYWLRYAATIGDTSYVTIAGKTLPPMPGLKRPPFMATAPLAIFR